MTFLKALEDKITRISDTDYTPGSFSLEHLLVGASRLYGAATSFRARAFESGLFTSHGLNCPVISVGNMVAGGTGKTPMTLWLVRRLQEMGLSPAVLSRGYKGEFKGKAAVVGDGKTVFLGADMAGDEPHMMARTLDVPVVVGRERYHAGLLAMKTFQPQVLVLDDGFQHLKLKRDLDIVLMDHDRPFGNHRLLPAGRLRENPRHAGRRINGIVLTRCPQDWGPEPVGVKRAFPGVPLFKSRHCPVLSAWQPRADHTPAPALDDLKGARAVLVSAIARNSAFRTTVESLGVKVVDHLEFPDHYRYKEADFSRMKACLSRNTPDIFMVTEKDWVKFPAHARWGADLVAIGIDMELEEPNGFKTFMETRLAI